MVISTGLYLFFWKPCAGGLCCLRQIPDQLPTIDQLRPCSVLCGNFSCHIRCQRSIHGKLDVVFVDDKIYIGLVRINPPSIRYTFVHVKPVVSVERISLSRRFFGIFAELAESSPLSTKDTVTGIVTVVKRGKSGAFASFFSTFFLYMKHNFE